MSTPADHGYLRCVRCGVWRRQEDVEPGKMFDPDLGVRIIAYSAGAWRCLDVAWCSTQAGEGQGRLDADTGAP